jgi:(R)-2-hydroxyacyl-CoA dehydratese activating ATPase
MIAAAGLDVGSTYTKAVVLGISGDCPILGRALVRTGFRLTEAAGEALAAARSQAGIGADDVVYVLSTGYGRFLVPFRDTQVTDLTAQARGARFLFPAARTVLDVGGQTMKASRLDQRGKVLSFRLNDKCAAGTGAFLEKTARYLGYDTEEIGALAATSKTAVSISGVCAVFAESEVINHVSMGASAADILHGAIASLVDRSVQLLRRVRLEPEVVLTGGILRFDTMVRLLTEKLGAAVQVPAGDLVQFTGALGAAILARRRYLRLQGAPTETSEPIPAALPPTPAGLILGSQP